MGWDDFHRRESRKLLCHPAESVAMPFLPVVLPIVAVLWGYAFVIASAGRGVETRLHSWRRLRPPTDNGTEVRVSTLVSFIP